MSGLSSRASSIAVAFGGGGFVGRRAVGTLLRRGVRVRSASRRPDLSGDLRALADPGRIALAEVDVSASDERPLAAALVDADVVVMCVGALQPVGRSTFEGLHVDGARRVARLSRESGVRRLVHVSALGADASSPSRYARTKAEGESAVLEEFPSATILRPSAIFGAGDSFLNRFASMARMSPILPLVGVGTRLQPTYVGDVADAVAFALGAPAVERDPLNPSDAPSPDDAAGKVFELGGPQILSLGRVVEMTLEMIGRRRPIVPIPESALMPFGLLLERIPGAPITREQLLLLRRDNVVSESARSEGRVFGSLGVEKPRSIESVAGSYLRRYRRGGVDERSVEDAPLRQS